MSRSRKKSSYMYWCDNDGVSKDKTKDRRTFRRKTRQVLYESMKLKDIYEMYPPVTQNEIRDVWSWDVDGKKHWFSIIELTRFYSEFHPDKIHQIMMK